MGLEERKQTKEIEGVTYECTPLMFGVGQKALMRLIKVVSPVVAGMTKGGTPQEMVAGIFEALPLAMSDEDIAYFSKVFGSTSKYQNGAGWVGLTPEIQETHFAGEYTRFVRWLLFCIQVNFSGFFAGGMTGIGAEFMQLVTKKAG